MADKMDNTGARLQKYGGFLRMRIPAHEYNHAQTGRHYGVALALVVSQPRIRGKRNPSALSDSRYPYQIWNAAGKVVKENVQRHAGGLQRRRENPTAEVLIREKLMSGGQFVAQSIFNLVRLQQVIVRYIT